MSSSSRYEETMKTKHFRPFRIGHVTEDLAARAEKELGETERARAEAIPALRKMVQEDTKLRCCVDDAYLLQYLRARKFNLKKALSLFHSFWHVKKSHPELYGQPDIPLLRQTLKTGAIAWLPYRDTDACPVLMLKMCLWDPDELSLPDMLRALTAVLLIAIDDPATQVTGVRIVLDSRGTSLKQVRQITPRYIHLISRALRNCLPVRFKGIHIYNEAVLFHYLYGIFKIFLTEKIKNRIHFHGDNQKQLQKFLPKAILPTDYGGDNDVHSTAVWFPQEMERYYDTFIKMHSEGYES